ncbi:MAG: IS110 family transposase [Parvibaculum sp.]|jgi:transposase|uniref:IS110 family transposase n=1 Tax=Parvibaculum sp. TaxID=2024848 RepID=UPI001B0E25F7|nr:IS110 family transposase [Parvibaculum sp.]MBO6686831.1 IS110 family transposase [Parvibaculum sp.]MBO6724007.1 IS110 family transposase [Roseitalea sp.]
MQVSVVGLDLAKNVFQVHAIDERGAVVVNKQLRRSSLLKFFADLDPCLIGMEACATSHYWARELVAIGHEVRLMPASYVKPYVKRGKNDALDAEAIAEAVTRPTMRFVAIKGEDQQSILVLHRTRDLLMRQRTALVNALRAHLAEFGIIAPAGVKKLAELMANLAEVEHRLPDALIEAVGEIAAQIADIEARVYKLEKRLSAWTKSNAVARRLSSVPGIGPITASAIAATVTDPGYFRSARQFAAWIGLTPLQNSSGGKERLGRISKKGDRYLRKLLVVGASAVIRYARQRGGPRAAWVQNLLDKKPVRVVQVALANKMARIAWAVMKKEESYQPGLSGAI